MKIASDGSIEFDDDDVNKAWNNAIYLINHNSDEIRMCYLCCSEIEKDNYYEKNKKNDSWVIDFIDIRKIKKVNDKKNNLIAIHFNCFENIKRPKPNMTGIINRIKGLLWKSE